MEQFSSEPRETGGSFCSDTEDYNLPGCDAVRFCNLVPTLRRNLLYRTVNSGITGMYKHKEQELDWSSRKVLIIPPPSPLSVAISC
jgi:hypothetical protein